MNIGKNIRSSSDSEMIKTHTLEKSLKESNNEELAINNEDNFFKNGNDLIDSSVLTDFENIFDFEENNETFAEENVNKTKGNLEGKFINFFSTYFLKILVHSA